MFGRKNKNKISRQKRIEIYKDSQEKKKGLVFHVPKPTGKNIPSHYANEYFGRPEKTFSISYVKIFLAIFALATLAYVMFFSPIFKIKKIVVVNNQILLEGDVVKFLEERNIKNKNLFLVDTYQIRDVLKDYYKRVEDVKVYRVFPAKLKIKIKEKPSSVIWVTGEGKYLLDSEGYVIPGASSGGEDLKMPIVIDQSNVPVKDGDRVVTKGFIDFVNSADESLKKRFGLGINNYSISQTTFELKVHINSGFYIVFDTTADIVDQLDKLAKVYQQGEVIKEYVILSVNGRVIVK